ncbi:hypothetical protein M4R22_19030 [Acidovorax sp. GBBC 3334]|uniref:hypothetical protein n=1 Tax=Acidovorax sp. GBBC 3334 TaxID=2940496 RepID=UPI0023037CEE|nr:hypothetical protein [Acidovorax sp. GBBC 3334]MDA8456859.1 hypothetical protein [Acidovorax sp. GBBC 3334]
MENPLRMASIAPPLSLTVALATAAALLSACSRDGDAPSQAQSAPASAPVSGASPTVLAVPATASSQPEDPTPYRYRPSHYRYLHAVYCNGVVDRIDLEQRVKVKSFQLSERSGPSHAIAAAPSPGVKPDSCLARPVSPQSAEDMARQRVQVIATDQFYRQGDDPRKRYRLLTFSLPDWRLEKAIDLGSFDVLNGAPPRVAGALRDAWAVLPPGEGKGVAQKDLAGYQGMDNVASPEVAEWSATTALVEFANAQGRQLPEAGLADMQGHRFTRLGEPPNALSNDVRLAPGGRYALRRIERMVRQGQGVTQVQGTGELRLYGADGKLAATLQAPHIAGGWHTVALTPQGLAVFTDGAGGYRFVHLGREFGVQPVADAWTDDLDGTRPGVAYSER